MARGKAGSGAPGKRAIAAYDHKDKQRPNNPPVGLVTPETDRDLGRKTYAYDPHLDPQLQWAGKAERLSFEVPTVSLHVHERIDPRTILEAVRKRNGDGHGVAEQPSLFETREANPPLREAIEFYKHPNGWTNRMVAGDSLLVMNSLLEKEGMAGKVQMIYMDPPYGIKYGSNFQPFVNKRDVKDGKDEDLTQEPEMIRAFRDTWELGIHSYLSYLRDRLLLCRELLSESGSCFVQISDENEHLVRNLMDEIFLAKNLCGVIVFSKTSSSSGRTLSSVADYLLWYAKDASHVKYRQLYSERFGEGWVNYDYVRLSDGCHRRMNLEERKDWDSLPSGARVYRRDNLTSQRPAQEGDVRSFSFNNKDYTPGKGTFKTDANGLMRLNDADRLEAYGSTLAYRRFADDFPFLPINNQWPDTLTGGFAEERYYVVQTTQRVIQRCLLMTTDPGDLVLDPTCGSGTTAYVAEQWGRRWITCDTSRVAVTLAKQRLMTALFDYYELAHPEEGVGSGFKYKTVPHVTLKSIANNPDIKPGMSKGAIDAAIARHADQETLYDQPLLDRSKARVTGPFTVEAVPAPTVRPISEFSVAQASSLQKGSQDGCATNGATKKGKLIAGVHTRGYLPHWKSQGSFYFVTFRLAGTLPKKVLDEYEAERVGHSITGAGEKSLRALYSEKIEAYLDEGRGDCFLGQPAIAILVKNALEHFAGDRYDLASWVIMPNHVHVVARPLGEHSLSDILHSWKSFTATEANKSLGRTGETFWQPESYDHVIRDESEFAKVCEYVERNPVATGLCKNPQDWPFGSAQGRVAQASSLQVSRQDAGATWTADGSIARSGESRRQDDWRSELLRCGIRGKGGQKIEFSRVEPLAGTRWLQADGETKDAERRRVVLSFGPMDAPLEQRQVAEALEEANLLVPKPKVVAFAAFHFDPEAAKDIDETNWPGVTLLKVQMNTDLLTEDLKKKRASSDSFWMVGQPDIQVRRVSSAGVPPPARPRRGTVEAQYDAGATDTRGEGAAPTLHEVEVFGFDYYNPKTGAIESGDTGKIALWLLDPDYDGRSLYPRQVFFPMAGDKEGWARLARNLKAEIAADLIETYRGSVSLPFELGPHKRVAVKIVDDRGIESLKILEVS